MDLEVDSMKKFILEYKRYSRNAQDNSDTIHPTICAKRIFGDHHQYEDDQELEEVMNVRKRWVYQFNAQNPSGQLKPKVVPYDQRQDGKADLTLSTFSMSKISNCGFMAPKDLTELPTKKSRSAS